MWELSPRAPGAEAEACTTVLSRTKAEAEVCTTPLSRAEAAACNTVSIDVQRQLCTQFLNRPRGAIMRRDYTVVLLLVLRAPPDMASGMGSAVLGHLGGPARRLPTRSRCRGRRFLRSFVVLGLGLPLLPSAFSSRLQNAFISWECKSEFSKSGSSNLRNAANDSRLAGRCSKR